MHHREKAGDQKWNGVAALLHMREVLLPLRSAWMPCDIYRGGRSSLDRAVATEHETPEADRASASAGPSEALRIGATSPDDSKHSRTGKGEEANGRAGEI